MTVQLHFSLRKSTSKIGVKFFVFFTFLLTFFIMKILLKSKIYCHAVSLNHLFMYVGKILCQASLSLFLSLAIFYLGQCQVAIVCSAQPIIWLFHKLIKLFSSCRTVFELAQEYSHSKTSDFNNCSSNKALVQKEVLTICQDIRCVHNFYMCPIIIISFRKVHTSVL